MRSGRLNDARFGHRMRGAGPMADQIERLFELSAQRCGFGREPPPLVTLHFVRPGGEQQRRFG
jgi:hypothetical protein